MSSPEVVLALDVGGTKIAGALVDADGGIRARRRVDKPPAERRDPGLRHVLGVATTLLDDARASGLTVRGIGAGFPEYVDRDGRLASHEVLDWETQPADLLGRLSPTVVDSDVRCAALAEARRGAGAGLSSFLYVTVGTGISSCLVIDGRPVAGARGEAIGLGELGVPRAEAPVADPNGPGDRLEPYASGEGIRRRYEAASGRASAGAHEVIAAAAGGDVVAGRVVVSAAEALGEALAAVVALLDPEALVLGGGMCDAAATWWEPLERAYLRSTARRAGPPPLRRAALGPDAGLLGAALAFERSRGAG